MILYTYLENRQRADQFLNNRKDALVATFKLEPRAFKPKWQETGAYIQITVYKESYGEMLGYVKFHKRSGKLEFFNRQAKLERQHLNIGGGTKKGDDKFAGAHGEGFKLAALVFERSIRHLKITSNSHYWNFNLKDNEDLVCNITKIKPESSPTPKSLRASNDVLFEVSKKGGSGIAINQNEFLAWTEETLDLVLCNPNGAKPDRIISTQSGDLIFGEEFAGTTYLKGLRLQYVNQADSDFTHGYNFATGYINRDRQMLGSVDEEARTVAKIWAKPIQDGDEDALNRYLELFLSSEESADINRARDKVGFNVAKKLFRKLIEKYPGSFFYSETNSGKGETISDQVKKFLVLRHMNQELLY